MFATLIIIGSIFSSIFYRLGGAGNYGQWYARYLDTKWRDFLCPLIVVLLLGYTFSWHWSLIPSFLLMFGACTTYWKKSVDARWIHWLAHGFGIAFALLPTAIHEGFWLGFSIRCLVLPILMMLASGYLKNPVQHELGRGFAIPATIPILLL